MFAQAGVGIFISPQLSDCVFDWIPLGSRLCILKLKETVIIPNADLCPQRYEQILGLCGLMLTMLSREYS